MNTLIIDSGGTKAHWVFTQNGKLQKEGTVAGIHPFFLTEAELSEKLFQIKKELPAAAIQEIFHYGTGTNSKPNQERLLRAYQAVFIKATTIIDSDLLAVAHALCGRKKGIAAILGTGSNVGLYDGQQLIKTVGGLGYVLGDEGSGAHLGRILLNAYLNELLPNELHDLLEQQYDLSRDRVLESVYRKPFPNRYLASMAPFLAENNTQIFISTLIKDCFKKFIEINILPLKTEDSIPLCCGGSIAFHFQRELRVVAKDYDVRIDQVAISPMEGLVAYHAE